MPYTAVMRAAIGRMRSMLVDLGLPRQDPRFAEHGDHTPAPDAPLVLVACSGGRDSMALAAVAGIVCASWGIRCGAIVVDHRLQEHSDEVAQSAARRCCGLGLDPVAVVPVEVSGDGHGVEAAARDARYRALADTARRESAACVLLAHTGDDQAETVLMDVLRSSGLDALAGMPRIVERDGVRFARPFLRLTRADTTGICEDLGITWWDDPTNGDHMAADEPLPDDFPLRSRVRHTLIPYLNAFAGGDIVSRFCDGAELASIEKSYLDGIAESVAAHAVTFAGDSCGSVNGDCELLRIDAKALAREPRAIRLRVIAHALAAVGIEAGFRHVDAVDRLISQWHGQGAVALPSGHSAFRRKHVIRVCQDGLHANR